MDTTTPPPVGPGVVSRRTLAAGAAWSVPVIMAASAAPAMAASGCSGPRPPTVVSDSGWNNPARVLTEDNSFADEVVSGTENLLTSTFGFTTAMVPSGSTIVSVQIDVRWYVTDDIGDPGTGPTSGGAVFRIQARNGATQIGTQYQLIYNGSNWPIGSGNAITTSYSLTGTMPTDTVVRTSNFGAFVEFVRTAGDNYRAWVDFIRITVCYR